MTINFRTDSVMRGWWQLQIAVAAISLCGCTHIPPYHAGIRTLPAAQFSSTNTPDVRIRVATPAERKLITDFTGKKESERSARVDMAGAIILSPALIVFCWPDIIYNVMKDNHVEHEQQARTQEAMSQFQVHLNQGIQQRLLASPRTEPGDILELVYVADIQTIGPSADQTSFIFHGQLTFRSHGTLEYQEILRIDPRAFSDDVPPPKYTESAETILHYADEAIPKMIQTRLPGLPWQPNP